MGQSAIRAKGFAHPGGHGNEFEAAARKSPAGARSRWTKPNKPPSHPRPGHITSRAITARTMAQLARRPGLKKSGAPEKHGDLLCPAPFAKSVFPPWANATANVRGPTRFLNRNVGTKAPKIRGKRPAGQAGRPEQGPAKKAAKIK